MKCDISIIIPMYNDEKYIKECINSVENQTLKNLEIICIDDGSEDGTLAVAENLCELDDRIQVYSQKHGGAGIARNKGLELAKGEYVAFLDADDFYYDTNALEILVNECRNHQKYICGSNYVVKLKDGNKTEYTILDHMVIPDSGCSVSFSEYQNDYFYTCFIFRRKFLEDNHILFPDYMRYQDPVFFLRALHFAKDFWMTPCTLYCYRIGHKERSRIAQNAHHVLMAIRDNMEFSATFGYMNLFQKLVNRLNKDYANYIVENISEDVRSTLLDVEELIKKYSPDSSLEILDVLRGLDLQPEIYSVSNILFVNCEELDEKIKNIHNILQTRRKQTRKEKIIISLTSYPRRIPFIKYTLFSLLMQSLQADEVVLWLSEEEFPQKEKDLPSYLLEWEQYGVKVRWIKENLKSYKKIIPALETYKKDIIVTADDDIYYLPEWLKILYEEYEKDPCSIISHRARKVLMNGNGDFLPYKKWFLVKNITDASKLNFLTSGGGVLFPPDTLPPEAKNKDKFMKYFPHTDDIWLWGMAILNDRNIRVPEKNIRHLVHVDQVTQLSGANLWNINQEDNDKKIQALIMEYPVIYQKLLQEIDGEFSKKCIIYGAGKLGLEARSYYRNILFYVDQAYSGKEGRILDKKIYGPEILRNYNEVPILIAVEKKDGIFSYLKKLGMKNISNYLPEGVAHT